MTHSNVKIQNPGASSLFHQVQRHENEEVSTKLVDLKELCNIMLVEYLTEGSQQTQNKSLSEFFENIVLDKYSHLLIDICDYWVHQLYFRVPATPDTNLLQSNLDYILNYIESNQCLVVNDSFQTFCKWIKFVRYLPQ